MRTVRDILLEDEELERGFRLQDDQSTEYLIDQEESDGRVPDVSKAGVADGNANQEEISDDVREDVRSVPDGVPDSLDDLIEPETNDTDFETFDEVPDTSGPVEDLSEPESEEHAGESFQSYPQPDESEIRELDDIVEPQSNLVQVDDQQEPPSGPAGFMGFRDGPSIPESSLETFEDSRGNLEEQSERHLELKMRSNEDLASQLAIELGPQFDEIREQQAQTTRDFVQSQIILNDIMRQV